MQFELTDAPSDADFAALGRSLGAFNDADAGAGNLRLLAIFGRGEDGSVTAGLYGFTAWEWLYTQRLWLHESLRGQGLAAQMLQMAEAEAVARGCHSAWIDTFNPVALRVYLRVGYEVFGELPEFPRGRTRSFLRKRLA